LPLLLVPARTASATAACEYTAQLFLEAFLAAKMSPADIPSSSHRATTRAFSSSPNCWQNCDQFEMKTGLLNSPLLA
jgi:hypothetical protein